MAVRSFLSGATSWGDLSDILIHLLSNFGYTLSTLTERNNFVFGIVSHYYEEVAGKQWSSEVSEALEECASGRSFCFKTKEKEPVPMAPQSFVPMEDVLAAIFRSAYSRDAIQRAVELFVQSRSSWARFVETVVEIATRLIGSGYDRSLNKTLTAKLLMLHYPAISHGQPWTNAEQLALDECLNGCCDFFRPQDHFNKQKGQEEMNPTSSTYVAVTANATSDDAPPIQKKTLIFGKDLATMSEDEQYAALSKLEKELEKLEAIKTKPKKLVAKIGELKRDLDSIAAAIDEVK